MPRIRRTWPTLTAEPRPSIDRGRGRGGSVDEGRSDGGTAGTDTQRLVARGTVAILVAFTGLTTRSQRLAKISCFRVHFRILKPYKLENRTFIFLKIFFTDF